MIGGPGKTYAWPPIVLVEIQGRTAIAGSGEDELVGPGIPVGLPVVAGNRPRRDLIAKPEVEGERGQNLEIILRIPRILPVALVRSSLTKCARALATMFPSKRAG